MGKVLKALLVLMFVIDCIVNIYAIEITQEQKDQFEEWKKQFGQSFSNDGPNLKYD